MTLAISCGEDIEKKAGHHLDNAKEAFSIGNYNVAKQEIDSIKILYPKAFEARRQGIKLMQQIEEAEQMRIIEYEDSMIAVSQAAFEKIKANYAFEKDERYQDIGFPVPVLKVYEYRAGCYLHSHPSLSGFRFVPTDPAAVL